MGFLDATSLAPNVALCMALPLIPKRHRNVGFAMVRQHHRRSAKWVLQPRRSGVRKSRDMTTVGNQLPSPQSAYFRPFDAPTSNPKCRPLNPPNQKHNNKISAHVSGPRGRTTGGIRRGRQDMERIANRVFCSCYAVVVLSVHVSPSCDKLHYDDGYALT